MLDHATSHVRYARLLGTWYQTSKQTTFCFKEVQCGLLHARQ